MVEDRAGGTARADTAAQDLAGEVGGEGVARGDVLQGDGGGAVDPGEPGRARVDVGADLPALDEGVGVPGDDVALDAERARVTAAVDTPADVRAVDDADVGVAGDVLVPRVAAAEDAAARRGTGLRGDDPAADLDVRVPDDVVGETAAARAAEHHALDRAALDRDVRVPGDHGPRGPAAEHVLPHEGGPLARLVRRRVVDRARAGAALARAVQGVRLVAAGRGRAPLTVPALPSIAIAILLGHGRGMADLPG